MSMHSQIRLYHLSSMLIAAAIAAVLVSLMNYYGPRIEGRLWPVAVSTDTNVDILPETNKILIDGTMSKYRKCDLISSVAYINDAVGNRVIAKIEPTSTIKLRPLERNVTWGPWKIDVPIWYKRAWLTVVTVHQCHPFWQTQTEFVRKVIDD